MKRTILSIVIALMSVLCGKSQTAPLDSTLINGDWAAAKPLDSLKNGDTLILAQTPKVCYGWFRFLKDSSLDKRRIIHYCQPNKKGAYVMSMKYQWDKVGTWEMRNRKIVLSYAKRTILLKQVYLSKDKIGLVVIKVTQD
jgi:hypothetical protein